MARGLGSNPSTLLALIFYELGLPLSLCNCSEDEKNPEVPAGASHIGDSPKPSSLLCFHTCPETLSSL